MFTKHRFMYYHVKPFDSVKDTNKYVNDSISHDINYY